MTSQEQPRSERRFRLNQETLAIIGVGAVLAGLILSTTNDLRAEARALRAEAQADRDAFDRKTEALRAEAQADREALRAEARADRKAFEEKFDAVDRKFETIQSEILRLTKGQAALAAHVTQIAANED